MTARWVTGPSDPSECAGKLSLIQNSLEKQHVKEVSRPEFHHRRILLEQSKPFFDWAGGFGAHAAEAPSSGVNPEILKVRKLGLMLTATRQTDCRQTMLPAVALI